jgi:hypothetical protein
VYFITLKSDDAQEDMFVDIESGSLADLDDFGDDSDEDSYDGEDDGDKDSMGDSED